MERFACELRALRALAGDLPFWKMARRCAVAKSALAAAAAGRQLPSEKVTQEFVRACGGDWAYWHTRWVQAVVESDATQHRPGKALAKRASSLMDIAHSRPLAAPLPDKPWTATNETKPPDSTPQLDARPLRPRPRRRLIFVIAFVAVVAVFTYLMQTWVLHIPGTAEEASPTVTDGTDPQAVGCSSDATNLEVTPVRLEVSTILRGRTLARGTQVGTVTLRYSARCAGAWARFDPAPVIDTELQDTTAGVTTVWSSRPADTTQETWKMGHIDNSYSGILLTGIGCVIAGASVEVINTGASAHGKTSCLPARDERTPDVLRPIR
ncbi:DUF2690 domain-containing protein [Streptomyces griseoluteus]|uniref:DUF2690 domain-containing protein n=1 Tax=Streptomyces griseoluteus TaxID=29306 RepID=UPI00382709D4